MLVRNYIDAALSGIACMAVARVANACGFIVAQLPELPDLKTTALDPWNMGAAGFVVWYAWYVTAKIIPKLVAQHGEQVKDLTAKHAEHVKDLTAKHAEHVKEIVADFRAEANQIRADARDAREVREAGCKKQNDTNSGRQG